MRCADDVVLACPSQCAGIIKDSIKEFKQELEMAEEPCAAPALMESCMAVLDNSLAVMRSSAVILTECLKLDNGSGVLAVAAADSTGDGGGAAKGAGGSASAYVERLDEVCTRCDAVEDAVVDFADAMNDLEVRPDVLLLSPFHVPSGV